jgi:hypothetical protein
MNQAFMIAFKGTVILKPLHPGQYVEFNFVTVFLVAFVFSAEGHEKHKV